MKKFFASICVAGLLLSGCVNEKPNEQPSQQKVAQVEQKNFYSDGQFKVGVDIPAGEYLAVGTGYVEVAKSSESNDSRNILINDNIENAQRYVVVNDGEYVKVLNGLKLYPATDAPKIDTGEKVPSGQFKIGTDIPAGEYKITLEAGGYFAVTRDTRRAYVKNQYTNEGGSFYATVADGQYLQIKKGTGEFVGAATVNVEQPVQVSAPPPAPAKVLNLGMTADQFQAAYNAKIREISQDVDWDVSSANLTSNPNEDVFEYAFSSDGILFWTVEKNTTLLKGVGVMSQPKDILESSKMSFAYTVAILTLSPELNIEQRNSLLHTLKLTTDKIAELETSRGIAVVGNVRYTTQFMGGTFLFTATAKDL